MEENVVVECVNVTLRSEDGVKFFRATSKSAFVSTGWASAESSLEVIILVRVSFRARASRRTMSAGMYPSVLPAMSRKSRLGETRKPSLGAAEEEDVGREDGLVGSIQELSDMLCVSLGCLACLWLILGEPSSDSETRMSRRISFVGALMEIISPTM